MRRQGMAWHPRSVLWSCTPTLGALALVGGSLKLLALPLKVVLPAASSVWEGGGWGRMMRGAMPAWHGMASDYILCANPRGPGSGSGLEGP